MRAMPVSPERLFQALERIQVGWPRLVTVHLGALHGVSRPSHSTAKAPPAAALLPSLSFCTVEPTNCASWEKEGFQFAHQETPSCTIFLLLTFPFAHLPPLRVGSLLDGSAPAVGASPGGKHRAQAASAPAEEAGTPAGKRNPG